MPRQPRANRLPCPIPAIPTTKPALLAVLALGVALSLAGCSQDRRPEMAMRESAAAAPSEPASPGQQQHYYSLPGRAGDEPAPTPTPSPMPARLIRTGSVTVEVESAEQAARVTEEIAERHGGYVSAVQGSRDHLGRSRSSITIRVAPDGFHPAMSAVRALGVVEQETVSTEDVGQQYADLEARLRTKQAVAARMREILAKNTASLSDIFEAERQLSAVLEEIERLEGQRRYFDAQVSLSTITAVLHEPEALVVAVAAELPPFLRHAREALVVAREHLSVLVGAATYVVVVIVPWLLLAGLVILLVTRLRRRTVTGAP